MIKFPEIKKELENSGHEISLPNCFDDPATKERYRAMGTEQHSKWKNDKKIFLLNEIPLGLPHTDEIETFDPIFLNGDLKNIK